MQVGHHVDAYDAQGRAARPGTGFATEVWADFSPRKYSLATRRHDGEPVDSLAEARAYCHELLARYPSVYTCYIRESIQDIDFVSSWKAGRNVDTITREVAPAKPMCKGYSHIWPTYQVGRCACGTVSSD